MLHLTLFLEVNNIKVDIVLSRVNIHVAYDIKRYVYLLTFKHGKKYTFSPLQIQN